MLKNILSFDNSDGIENKINWLTVRGRNGVTYLKSQVISHPYTGKKDFMQKQSR